MKEPKAFAHTIGGRAVPGEAWFDVIDPSTGAVFAQAPDATRAQLDLAVSGAREAFVEWRVLAQSERVAALRSFAARVREEIEGLSRLLTLEQGKPITNAQREVRATADRIDGMAALEIKPEILREDASGRVLLDYQPLGVVGAIAPWNAPLILATQIAAQALVAGNTVIVKPSPFTPLTTLRLGEIAAETLPAGVLNVVSGGNALGQWMTEHPGIDKIGFVGSTVTGKKVLASAASSTLKRVSLELGGNDPAIVLDDVDVDAVAARLFWSAFNNSGQICMAVKRVFAHESVAERLTEALARKAQHVKVGSGFEPDVEIGPLQNKPQYDKVLSILQDARERGARFVTGGKALPRPGYFIAPTIVSGLEEGSRLVDEEQFGPVLPVLTFKTIDEAVRRANATRYGLGASVWSADVTRAQEVATQLEAGTVWINAHGGASADVPFGGFKESGVGRALGMLGLKSYLEARVIHLPRASSPGP
jgi:acyl-CoA reductase-like NAD-dependent aldehyde dehydrogenase